MGMQRCMAWRGVAWHARLYPSLSSTASTFGESADSIARCIVGIADLWTLSTAVMELQIVRAELQPHESWNDGTELSQRDATSMQAAMSARFEMDRLKAPTAMSSPRHYARGCTSSSFI